MKSMTACGGAEVRVKSGLTVRADITSYNKKQLEVRVVLDKDLCHHEYLVRRHVSNHISRGAVFVKVEVVSAEEALARNVKINFDLAASYLRQIERLGRKTSLAAPPRIDTLLALPGVVQEFTPEKLVDEKHLVQALDKAMAPMLKMRETEGRQLGRDIKTRVQRLSGLTGEIAKLASGVSGKQAERMISSLKSLGISTAQDDERIVKEIVILADRLDVSEEITRLRSHFSQFISLLDSSESVGRTLEFLVQEIQREITTLGNKAPDAKISRLVIEFKTELEKIREQAQNVE